MPATVMAAMLVGLKVPPVPLSDNVNVLPAVPPILIVSPAVNVEVVPVPKIALTWFGVDALPRTLSVPVLNVTELGATGNKAAAAIVRSGFTAPAY